MNDRVEKRLAQVVWNQRQLTSQPDIKPDGKNWLMDTMPFNAVLKEKLIDDYPLQYLCEGKYISFKPVGGLSAKGLLSTDKRSVAYKDGLGAGISIEVQVSQAHWRKLIKIDKLPLLDVKVEFFEFKFEVETDFDVPERENKKPRIKLGENSCIEVAQAWDSAPEVFDEETGETPENKIPVRSFFKKTDDKLYFVKQIPTDWLKTATFPVWTDTDIVYGTAQGFGDAGHQCDLSQCCEIDTNKFVVVYADPDLATAGLARVGTVSGTTITWGAISQFCSGVSIGYSLGVCKLDTDKFVVVYADNDTDDDGFARVGEVTTRTIAWGPAKEFHDTDIEYPACCQLETDKFAILYNDETGGDIGTICICTVDDDPAENTIHPGTPVSFEGKITTDNSCCKLDTDKFVAFYIDTGDSKYPKACAFSVVGTVPTAGAILEIAAVAAYDASCCQLDTDKCVIAWGDFTNSKSTVEILTRDNDPAPDTLHEGSEVDFSDVRVTKVRSAKIDATHFVLVYRDSANDDKGTSRFCSFSGTTVSLDGEEIFNDAPTSFISTDLISEDKIVVVYRDDGDVDFIGEAIIGDKAPPPLPSYPDKTGNIANKMVAAGLI